jgi:uncharacterized protein
MTLFLLAFIVIYGGMHCYVYIRLNHSFRFSRSSRLCFQGWMVFTTLAPIIVRLLEEYGYDTAAKALAWPGFIWMGFIYILVTLLLLIDTASFSAKKLFKVSRYNQPALLRPDITAELALLLAVVFSGYGLWEASNIKPVNITIQSGKLPQGVQRIRVVQISDIHLGLLIRENRLKNIIRVVNDAKPDLLVSTGDLVDGRLSRQEDIGQYLQLSQMLSQVNTPLGKYAVLGNHEVYAGLEQSIRITEAAGFRLLRGSFAPLPAGLVISGVDDSAVQQASSGIASGAESELLKSLPADVFRLHLKHRPLVNDADQGLFDLQLSGHTHRGQIFPFYLLTKIRFPIPSGTTILNGGSTIHVSNGTGTWGPPIRFLAPPEVTVIDIIPLQGRHLEAK